MIGFQISICNKIHPDERFFMLSTKLLLVWGQLYALLLSIFLMSIHHNAIFQYFIKHLDIADSDPGARVVSCIFLDGVQEEGSSI